MKKYIVLFLCLLLILSCCSCKPAGLTLPDGSMLYTQTSISNKKQLEFKGEDGTVLLNEKDVAWVYEKYSEASKYHLILEFTVDGATKLANVTKENIGKEISLFVDGKKVISTTIEAEITDGDFVMGEISSYRKLTSLREKITG